MKNDKLVALVNMKYRVKSEADEKKILEKEKERLYY